MKSSEPLPDDLERLVGSTAAGKYRVERLIGRGGMGAVFLATNVTIGKRVALKFLGREAAQDSDRALRFQREARAAGMVESDHIVHVFDTGTSEDGLPFLVMELLSGEDLRARLRREGSLPIADAVNWTAQVLRGLVRAHAAGIVHRDLKPDNVFLCRRDDGSVLVKLVDFGISKLSRGVELERLTRRGTLLGSVYYVSPEQAQASEDVDQRSDIFSVGAMLFEMLAGRPPHVGRTLEAILVAICTQAAPDVREFRKDTPAALAGAVARALAREPRDRFANAAEFLEALGAGGSGEGARRPGVSRTFVAGLLAALLGFGATALFVLRPTPRDTASASDRTSTPELASRASAAAATTPAPSHRIPPPELAPVTASAASAAASGPAPPASRPSPPSSSGRARKPKPRGDGVANSLELSTREP